MDRLDTQIARCIQISPRVPLRQVADVLGVAEQTVARRYRRLRRDGLIRVTLAYNPVALGATVWLVRVRCRPEAVDGIAEALARRRDVSWVSIHSAGWEVMFNLRSASDAESAELLTRILPSAAQVIDVSPASILHVFAGGSPTDWEGWRDVLTRDQAAAIRATIDTEPDERTRSATAPPFTTLTTEDRRLIETLSRDGRTPYTSVARTLGTTVGRVTRRVEALIADGAVYLDVDIAPGATGSSSTTVWLTAQPARLEAIGTTLAADPDVPFVAATSGRTNLTASVMSAGQAQLYEFVTGSLARIEGITGYELVPLTRRVKHAASLVSGDRLAPPGVPVRPRR